MSHEHLPIAFKVRTQGRYTGAKGGEVKPGGGGAGALWYEDKTFTVATHQDQWLLAPVTQGTPTTFPMSPANHQGPKLKYLSVCSGMEAASVAWHPLGWEPVGFSEIEPFPAAILAHRFPNTTNYGDLTKHAEWPIEPGSVDLLVGGTPCQSFSVAGLRKGMQDPRGNLALTFLGLADRLRPRWIVWENVPGVLSSNGGRDFGAFLGALGQLGYGWAYRVLDAQHFGVPQRRRRVFVVATSSGDGRLAGEVLSLPEGLRGYLEARRKKGQGAPSGPAGGVDADGGKGTIDCTGDGISGTVSCKWSKGSGGPAGDEHYNMVATPYRKAKRAQSDKDDESWVEGDVSNTLNNFDLGDTRTTHAVVEPIPLDGMNLLSRLGEAGENHSMQEFKPGDPMYTLTKGHHHGVAHCSDVAPTVTSSGPPYSRTGNERVEAEALVAQPVNIYGGNKRSDRPNGGMYVREEDTSKCLDAANGLNPTCSQGGTAIMQPVTSPTLTASNDPSRSPQSSEVTAQVAAVHSASMAVRRLTPVECERLQGFPDNWSRIPWKGKPEAECPDGPRYKACGNSMAVPVMRWIGKQIVEVEARHAQGKTA